MREKPVLTTGPILKTLLSLAMPIMASSFLGTVYGITDMAWIGFLGSKAVAGVGVGGMFLWLSAGLCSLARMGGQVNVAQAIGRGDSEEAREYAKSAIQIVAVFGILYGLIGLLLAEKMVGVFHLGDELAVRYGIQYTRITSGLILFSYLTMVGAGIYTASGDSKTPLKANAAGLVLNMILDPLMILGIGPFPKLGVIGAAVATVTAEMISLIVLTLSFLTGKRKTEEKRPIWGLLGVSNGKYYSQIIKIGLPTAIQGTTYCLISMTLMRMIAVFGAAAVAVQNVGGQLESVCWYTADGFGGAMNAFAGQNYGAGRMERVREAYKKSLRIIALWGCFVMLLFFLFPYQIAGVFFHEPEAMRIAVNYLRILGAGEAFMCVELLTIGTLSGLGKTRLCSIISILLTGSRIPIALALSSTALGLNGIWLTFVLTTVIKGITFATVFYRHPLIRHVH